MAASLPRCRNGAWALSRHARQSPSIARAFRSARPYSDSSSPAPKPQPATPSSTSSKPASPQNAAARSDKERELGPMARRLEEATEEALLTGGRAGRRAIEDAGFSEELKERLFSKVADAKFRAEHGATIAAAGLDPNTMSGVMPSSAGEGTRVMATGQHWTGDEAQEDTLLRMLNDAHKPLRPSLRGKPVIPTPSVPVDLRLRREPARSPAVKVATAREKASAYTGMGLGKSAKEVLAAAGVGVGKDGKGLSDKEREAMRKEFRDRFSPGARAMPNTVTGLAALANERIEDAIARGQFKNIPRGKGVERDARADNPFIDTTEYIMNKMIKRQEIVPPWIEKQQELVKAAHVFRARLRNDWTRHAARMIASRGGSLQEQMARAREHARAEEVYNPRRRNVDEISVPTNATDDPVMVKMREQAWKPAPGTLPATPSSTAPGATTAAAAPAPVDTTSSSPPSPSSAAPAEANISLTRPFRDPDWEAAERSYMELAVNNLNALTRSYNLMAPELAKKPYFSLDRELRSCFADVAPLLADAIKERAAGPSRPLGNVGPGRPRGVLDRLGGGGGEGGAARVYESKTPHYGFREMWRDLWNRPD